MMTDCSKIESIYRNYEKFGHMIFKRVDALEMKWNTRERWNENAEKGKRVIISEIEDSRKESMEKLKRI